MTKIIQGLIDTLFGALPETVRLPFAAISLALILIVIIWGISGWARKQQPEKQHRFTKQGTTREEVFNGVTIGFQLGRLEILDGAPFPEARAAVPEIRSELQNLLSAAGATGVDPSLDARSLIRAVLQHFSRANTVIRAAVLAGICAQRLSLTRGTEDASKVRELRQLAFSALQDASQAVVPNRNALFEQLSRMEHLVSTSISDAFWNQLPRTA